MHRVILHSSSGISWADETSIVDDLQTNYLPCGGNGKSSTLKKKQFSNKDVDIELSVQDAFKE